MTGQALQVGVNRGFMVTYTLTKLIFENSLDPFNSHCQLTDSSITSMESAIFAGNQAPSANIRVRWL